MKICSSADKLTSAASMDHTHAEKCCRLQHHWAAAAAAAWIFVLILSLVTLSTFIDNFQGPRDLNIETKVPTGLPVGLDT